MKYAVLGVVSAYLIFGCLGGFAFAAEKDRDIAEATAEIKDAKGRKVGTAVFKDTEGGVAVTIEVSGLSPGKRGMHIHETGKCDPPDFKSAGEHFNPTKRKHGLENPEGPHLGDMPNIEIGPDGKGSLEAVLENVALTGDAPNSLFHPGGTAIVIHAKPDDQTTDPAGESGDRIACGVIEKK
jgi:superoxide dismutase, Cu-Zn family